MTSFLLMTGVVLAIPVYAAPAPDAQPVESSIESTDLGSVDVPVDSAVVTTDGAVTDAGSDADVPLDGSVTAAPAGPRPAQPPTGPARPAGDPVASSGDELPGVPALTVSRPDTDRFTTLGVTWDEDPSLGDVSVAVRTKAVDGTWSPWSAIAGDDVEQSAGADDGGDVRGGTAPYWTDESYGVEVVVQATSGDAPTGVALQLIDPGTSPADVTPGRPTATDQADAALSMPAIYSRAQWGADESIRTWDADYARTISAATLHHTADRNDYTAADVPGMMRAIYAYHAKSRGWGDIGYNVVVDRFGRAWEGRYGGLASTVVGAHAGGFNNSTFGVSMLGNFDGVPVPQATVDTVAAVIAWKFSLYGVDPNGTTTLVSAGGGTSKYAAGTPVTLPTIFGHRDVGSTTCPGAYGYARLGEIRRLVAQRMADPALQVYSAQALTTDELDPSAPVRQTPRGDFRDQPLACDWDGDGDDTVGIFRAGRFFLFDSDDPSARPVADFRFGDAGDTAICGDWDGDGDDTVGVWRKGWFYLRVTNTSGPADGAFAFGNRDATPLVGNWDGDRYDTVGVHQGGAFFVTNSNIRPTTAGSLAFGVASDAPVVGDWDGDGRDSVGVYRADTYYLTRDLTRGTTDARIPFGDLGDVPLVGDWDGDGDDTLGVTRGY